MSDNIYSFKEIGIDLIGNTPILIDKNTEQWLLNNEYTKDLINNNILFISYPNISTKFKNKNIKSYINDVAKQCTYDINESISMRKKRNTNNILNFDKDDDYQHQIKEVTFRKLMGELKSDNITMCDVVGCDDLAICRIGCSVGHPSCEKHAQLADYISPLN